MSDHEELESNVAAWVLGALDRDEAEVVRAHVEGCASCRETMSRLQRAVTALPLVVEEVAPPARLRERVLAAAAASGGTNFAPSRVRQKVTQPTRPRVLVPLFGRLPAYAAAAAVVVALVVGLVAGDLAGRSGQVSPPSQVARFTLSGHESLAGAKATVIDLKADGLALVDFSGLPAVGQDRVYEVWLITAAGRADPAAVFVPDSNGSKVVLVNRTLQGYTLMALTNEAGPDGTQAPTQKPQLYGNVA
ncbi:MAG TPA: anti-sigma factor [Candidatus Dormibacteraeota bacterium]|jgi:anti-sigma-K factor RskA|nr:anti-sigma factor [Candidatus Dormibacteraeota bacterium]